jgi:hypothetical protein
MTDEELVKRLLNADRDAVKEAANAARLPKPASMPSPEPSEWS